MCDKKRDVYNRKIWRLGFLFCQEGLPMLKILSRKKFIIPIFIFILVVTLCLTRTIPSGICILTAIKYVNDNYPDSNFKYEFVEYSPFHDDYLVHFIDRDGNKMALMTSPLGGVIYDPLNPPG